MSENTLIIDDNCKCKHKSGLEDFDLLFDMTEEINEKFFYVTAVINNVSKKIEIYR